ncbi:MAG: hypothetical protein RRA45_00010 [Saccharolobus sp.]|jgi:hypothetical protein|uniref:hypothetical protein n=1 Tax=Saccharolobus sp. TaxID=2100761 RepID=UPI0028CBDA90|nr:hypothetical protein [Saccharolobus sp.]MDT7860595.1 hypothetical protein [Saccharolobus sp.]
MNPIYLEYKIIDNNISYYIIYVFIYNLSLKLVTIYVVNPNTHIILNYNVSLEPQEIFSNITGNQTFYNLNGNKILAYRSKNLIVAYNGLILKKVTKNTVECLVSANYPGIGNYPFPNLNSLAKISIFTKSVKILISGLLLTFTLSLILWTKVRQDVKS